MVTRQASPSARIFAVKGKVGDGDEIALHEVLTWAKLSEAEAFCAGTAAVVSSKIVVAEQGGSFEGGMTMVIGRSRPWKVRRENDRMVSPLKEGEVLSVLSSEWNTKDSKTRVWEIEARVVGRIRPGELYNPIGLGPSS